jgi:hypothetical protein
MRGFRALFAWFPRSGAPTPWRSRGVGYQWLEDNAKELGFEKRAAQRLIKAYSLLDQDASSTTHLEPKQNC